MSSQKDSKKVKKIIFNLLIVALSVVFVFAIVKIVSYYYQSNQSKRLNSSMAEEFVIYEEGVEPPTVIVEGDIESEPKEYYYAPIPKEIDFAKLIKQNSDVVGWIFNQNGVINYPILQGETNDYYLTRLINGKTNANGSIYMDSLNNSNFSDRNTIIYGHSMQNGTMFGTLLRYRYQSYCDAYPEFYIYTPYAKYRVEVFAAYETTINDKVYNFFTNESDFEEFLSYAKNKSKIKTEVSVTASEKIVTFSTCAYSSNDSRFVVCGKLVPIE